MTKPLSVLLFSVVTICLYSSFSFAAPVYFTDRAAFDAATGGGLTFDSFENLPPDPGVVGSQDFGDFTVSETGSTTNDLQSPFTEQPYVTDGVQSIMYFDNGPSIGSFQFDAGINAFGVDIITGWDTDITITGNVSASVSSTTLQGIFFGVYDADALFDSIIFDASGGGLNNNPPATLFIVAFDALSYGVADPSLVPVPAAVWLFGSGLLGLVGLARRKKA